MTERERFIFPPSKETDPLKIFGAFSGNGTGKHGEIEVLYGGPVFGPKDEERNLFNLKNALFLPARYRGPKLPEKSTPLVVVFPGINEWKMTLPDPRTIASVGIPDDDRMVWIWLTDFQEIAGEEENAGEKMMVRMRKTIVATADKLAGFKREDAKLVCHSFSGILMWHLIVREARALFEELGRIPEAGEILRSGFPVDRSNSGPFKTFWWGNPRLREAARFFSALSQFQEIHLISPTLLMKHVRLFPVKKAIEWVSQGKLVSPIARIMVGKLQKEEKSRRKKEFRSRVRTIRDLSENFEEEFKNWGKNFQRGGSDPLSTEDILFILKRFLEIRIRLGGRDLFMNTGKTRRFLRKGGRKDLGPIMDLFELLFVPKAGHHWNLAEVMGNPPS